MTVVVSTPDGLSGATPSPSPPIEEVPGGERVNEFSKHDALRWELADEAQRIAIDAEYLGRQHLIASEGWRRRVTIAAIPATAVVAALAAAGAGVAALLEADTRVIVILAFLAAIASVARMLLRPDDEAAGHSIKGLQYLAVRSDARRLRNITITNDRDVVAPRKELDQLVERLNALRDREPRALSPELLEKVRERVRRGDYAYENDPLWEAGPARETTRTNTTALEPSVEGAESPSGPRNEGQAAAPSRTR
jgi:hypothetical protein